MMTVAKLTRSRNARFASFFRLHSNEDQHVATPLRRLFDGHVRVFHNGF